MKKKLLKTIISFSAASRGPKKLISFSAASRRQKIIENGN
jgi:hypothetical protein